MGVFDGIGIKATEKGQKALQKAKDMSEVVRINSLISQNENKINNIYHQIGKLYVNTHKQKYDPEFTGMIASIVELEKQNVSYRKQVQDLRGVQRCENCGAELPRGVSFCSVCGNQLNKSENKQYNEDCDICSSCGAMVKRGMRFCTSCGHPMSDQNIYDPTKSNRDFSYSEESNNDENANSEIYCPNCGAKLDSDSAFCTDCGTKL